MNKIKVLMIDDNVNLINMVKEYFKGSNDVCIEYEAYDGLEGIKMIEEKQNSYDAIILDLIMPKKDGIYVLEEMKNRNINKKVIVSTSYNAADVIRQVSDFGVNFDIWTSEKAIRSKGRIEESLKILKDKGLTYEDDGATFLKTTEYGDDKDRVIIKSDGSYTYLVPDIAYHLDKFDRGYDYLVDVFGADHHSYVSRLKAAIEALGYDSNKLEVRLLQMVRLLRDGEIVKMSKRTGKTVTISELVEEIGKDAARYFFGSRSLDGQMDLDISIATKKTNENPFYYVGYAHARINSILTDEISKNIGINSDVNSIIDETTRNLLLKVYEFTDVVETSAIKKEPHLITNYVYELASMFHNYYAKHRILTDDIETSKKRLGLIKTIGITIKNSLNLIGVDAPDKM